MNDNNTRFEKLYFICNTKTVLLWVHRVAFILNFYESEIDCKNKTKNVHKTINSKKLFVKQFAQVYSYRKELILNIF